MTMTGKLRAGLGRTALMESLERRHMLSASTVAFEPVFDNLEVADINLQSLGLLPEDLTVAGGLLFFTADDGVHGRELWRTDGTSAGTNLVADVVEGAQSSFSVNSGQRTVEFGDSLFFVIQNAEGGNELWKSDGTEVGTAFVKSLPSRPGEMLAVNGRLFMSIGTSLWASDGTSAGTSELKALLHSPAELTAMGDSLYFSANELWTSDGTGDGTVMVKNVQARSLANMDGTLYFAGGTERIGNGVELWKSDGTADGTVEVKDIAPGDNVVGPSGPRSSRPTDFTLVDGTIYFTVSGIGLADIWQTDGTDAGTVPVDAEGGDLFEFDNQLYIQTSHFIRVLGEEQPFTPDMTLIRNLVVATDGFYFSAVTTDNGRELWKSDGTEAGTSLVTDINAGPDSGVMDEPMVIYVDRVFFAATDGLSGMELWSSDGSSDGTSKVYDNSISTGSAPHHLIFIGDNLFFTADDGVTPAIQLWSAAGENANLLRALPEPEKVFDDPNYPGSDSVDLMNFVAVGDELIFTHHFTYVWASANLQNEFELWKSDGTEAGTELLQPSYYTFFGEDVGPDVGPLFQEVHDDILYYEYGRYDGESAMDLAFDAFEKQSHFTTVGDQFFFSAYDPIHGRELWVTSDGFATYDRLSDVVIGQGDGLLRPKWTSHPRSTEMVEFGNSLIFTASVEYQIVGAEETATVTELWKSDGTSAGTELVGVAGMDHLANLTVAGEQLFFTAEQSARLWVSDGSPEGTRALGEFEQLGGDFVSWDGVLFFSADVGSGLELWRSDGTMAGTTQVAEIMSGDAGSAPGTFLVVGEKLLFAADDGEHGRELWVTDGTANGTQLYIDIWSGPSSSDPTDLAAVDTLLYFAANDGLRGRELWRSETNPVVPIPGDVNGDQVVDALDIDSVHAAVAAGFDDPIYDLNQDEVIDGDDATYLIEDILQTRRGDADLNGRIEFADFLALSRHYGKEQNASWAEGDFDGNAVISFEDFLILSANFGFGGDE